MSNKLIKTPDNIILAQDFKRIGRNTTIERSAIQLLGMASGQIFNTGLIQKLSEMFKDKVISPIEKNQLSLFFDSLTRDYSIAMNEATKREVDEDTIDSVTDKYNEIKSFLDKVLAEMNKSYYIQDDDPDFTVLLSEYDVLINLLQDLITDNSTGNEFYGTLKININLSRTFMSFADSTPCLVSADVFYKGQNINTKILSSDYVWTIEGVDLSRYGTNWDSTHHQLKNMSMFNIFYDEILTSGVTINCNVIVDTSLL